MFRSIAGFAAVVSLSACSDVLMPVDGEADVDASSRIAESSADAFGILNLLNDTEIGLDVLDDDAGLDSRAARSLIWHRNGPDGIAGTQDDDLFDSIAEVDDQYYVGATALDRLAAYAEANGFTPGDYDIVGSWDGVWFTLADVHATLDLANTATEAELDDTYSLDSRAVKGILEGRPFDTMDGLADAYYVGGSALTSLRDHAAAHIGGVEGDSCAQTDECADGFVCLGAINWGEGIFCTTEDATGTYTQSPLASIPDGGELSDSVVVDDLRSVPIDVVLTLDIDHERPEDLVVLLEDGNGQVATVWNRDANPAAENIVRAFPSDDMVNGTWTLTVLDEVAGVEGKLVSWELYITSTWD